MSDLYLTTEGLKLIETREDIEQAIRDSLAAVCERKQSPLDRLRAAHASDPIALLKLDLYERAVEVGDHHTALQILADHRMRMPRVSKASDAFSTPLPDIVFADVSASREGASDTDTDADG